MHRPRLLILDEPTAGVDVELRSEIWSVAASVRAAGGPRRPGPLRRCRAELRCCAPGSGTTTRPPAIANSSSGGVNQPEYSSFPSFPIGLLGKCLL
ncbi:hypothetical protein [Streptomyces roseochromogenus]|uniref:hypothetical protein n=1 Tax=Streptomyces roseochromogenus TaxID=285450 RepID=UPI003CC91014